MFDRAPRGSLVRTRLRIMTEVTGKLAIALTVAPHTLRVQTGTVYKSVF